MNNLTIIHFFISLSIILSTVWVLKKYQVKQQIYELSPDSHQQKQHTPTMGGIGILLSICVGVILFNITSPKMLWVFTLILSFGLLGFVDDYFSLKKEKNKGLSASHKFKLQVILAAGFVFYFHTHFLSLNWLNFLFYCFVIVATSNATNLTDGVDGLLSGSALISLAGFYYLIESNTFVLILMSTLLAFLLLNKNPAKVFMGDTGSLAIGAGLAGLALVINNPWVLLPLGIVYIIETLSVIIQVFWFKRTGNRVFLMSPLHHHFELMGLSEWKVVFLFWGIAGIGLGLVIGGGL